MYLCMYVLEEEETKQSMRGGMTTGGPCAGARCWVLLVGCHCRYARACFVITLVAMSLFPLKLKMPDHRYRHWT